ncbi:hypothetical protein C8Q76DRAFT_157258 [Earliella scabrosa]|nr:hypothetical protein C8Q76DRAFT_157258 [Earliella scabrosa]
MNTHSIIAQELSKRVSTTYGAVLIGNCVGLVLYGVVLHQAFRYYRLYPRDSWILKCLVGFVVILETFNSVLNVHICYHFLTNALVNPARLTQSIWSIALLPVASGGLVVACQSFFARRIILIGRHCRPIATVVIILLIGDAASTVEAFTTKTLERFSQVTWLFSVGSGIVTLADVIITTVLIVALRRSRTGFKGTDALIDVLILYAVNTGLLTGVFNTLAFVLVSQGDQQT